MSQRESIKSKKSKGARSRANKAARKAGGGLKRAVTFERAFAAINPRSDVIVPVAGSALSNTSIRKNFTYVAQGSNTHISGSATSFVMQANSCYDFDNGNTLGNKFPLGWDQFMGATGMYNYYRVHNTKIELTIWLASEMPTSTDITTPILTKIGMEELLFTPALGQSYANQDTVAEMRLMPGVHRKFLSKAGQKAVFTWTIPNVKKVFEKYGNEIDFAYASYASNPTNMTRIYGFATDDTFPFSTTLVTTFYSIRTVFDVELVDLRPTAS
ncbi:hypothetical protein [Shewanella sp.]|uniref:hypothetical protein n=1 Tax=Shewanella sp. TaxID=50422 RepID=UPI0040477469